MIEQDFFTNIAGDPGRYARDWKARTNGRVVGYFCSYAPEEIISASGALPFRILGTGGGISKADSHLQAYSCSLVRGALEDTLSGKLDFLDGTVFPHTCDSIQRLSDIWRLNTNLGFHGDVVMPVKLNTPSARGYMKDVLTKLKNQLEKWTGNEITRENLQKAAQTSNKIRQDLERLYKIRLENPADLSGTVMNSIFKASMVMDRNEFADKLEKFQDGYDSRKKSGDADGKKILLSGGLCNMPDIYPMIEDSGGMVVWDDFCTGGRYFEGTIDVEAENIVEAIADRYLDRVVCPAKHNGMANRGEYLVQKVKETGARGVIFMILKFCDPHSFDLPYMKEMLDKENIPSLIFEIEDQSSSMEQMRTRCQAFMEMI